MLPGSQVCHVQATNASGFVVVWIFRGQLAAFSSSTVLQLWWLSTILSTDLSTKNKNGSQLLLRTPAVTNAPCVIRTHDRLLRRQLLYPAELREHPVILAVRAERHEWILAIGF